MLLTIIQYNTKFVKRHVAMASEAKGTGRTLIPSDGRIGTNRDMRPSASMPAARSGAASNCTGAVKQTGDGREQRG